MRRAFTRDQITAVCENFPLPGPVVSATPTGTGHINDTLLVTLAAPPQFILQRINQKVFPNVPALMENIRRVTEHLARKLHPAKTGSERAEALTLVPARDGRPFFQDPAGDCWRIYRQVTGAHSHDVLEHPDQARAAAGAFGRFQAMLADLPGPRLHETIPNFHHTPLRYAAFERAVAADSHGRVAAAAAEIAAIRERRALAERVVNLHAAGAIPERIVHNDTKLNNVLLDDTTHRAVCVIDLDTVMPGFAPHDFGDMVRTACNSAAEDESDVSKIHCRLPVFAALVEGYLAEAGSFLRPAEVDALAFAGQLLTFEQAIRFLGDYLQGDPYYKIAHPEHNLVRTRAQLALLKSMEAQADAMTALVQQHR